MSSHRFIKFTIIFLFFVGLVALELWFHNNNFIRDFLCRIGLHKRHVKSKNSRKVKKYYCVNCKKPRKDIKIRVVS